jgi:hypothetical protein
MVTVIVVGVLANLPSSPHRRLYAAYTVDGGQISSIKATHNSAGAVGPRRHHRLAERAQLTRPLLAVILDLWSLFSHKSKITAIGCAAAPPARSCGRAYGTRRRPPDRTEGSRLRTEEGFRSAVSMLRHRAA